MTTIPSHSLQHGRSAYILAYLIRLLTAARKVRKAGFIVLLFTFLINCYFMLFDQQNYIMFFEQVSPDGEISDIFSVFLRIQTLIICFCIVWILVMKQSTLDSLVELSEVNRKSDLHWRHKRSPYIIAYIIWLIIAYLPFLFFETKTLKMLMKEDSFYEYSGFLWLLLTSISFFYLFFRKRRVKKPGTEGRRNIFFLLLGLLFFFGAGEEISWGQRIFHFHTPEIMSSNLQHEFNLHNMPLFDTRVSRLKDKNGQRITVGKTGIARDLSMSHLFRYFWFSFCVLIPVLYIISIRIQQWLNIISFPIVPIWVGLLFIINYYLYHQLIRPNIGTLTEIRETTYSFLFLILALWFINNRQDQRQSHDRISSPNG